MITLDYNRYDVIGIVNRIGTSQNAQIIGLGLSDRETGEFIPVQAADRNSIYPPRGSVFAYNFLKHHPELEQKCVNLCVLPDNKPDPNRDNFVWDWDFEPYIYADQLKELNTNIGEDGGVNYENLFMEGLLPCEETTYFICANRIYRLDPEIRIASFWQLSNISSFIITHNSDTYLLKNIPTPEDGKIDLTSDNQLIEWYKKHILRKEWETIYEAKDFQAINPLVTAELQKLRIPTNIFQSRLARIMSLNSNISLTFTELENLASTTWFKSVILNTFSEYKEKYIEKIKQDCVEEIHVIESEHKQKLSEINNKFLQEIDSLQFQINKKQEEFDFITNNIQDKKNELNVLKNHIENKNKVITELNLRKESIIADFNVIKEVLSTSSSEISNTKRIITVTDFNMNNEKEFSTAGPFKRNIESLLMKFNVMNVSAGEIVTKLSVHNIVLFPDDKTILATMQATRRCRYVVSYVSVDWKSFNNLWESGLSAITTEATRNPNIIHFLVLRNINMSFIPCYLQPIFDMESGLTKYFPETELEFPNNMKILCTRAKETIIPVTESSLENIGCISCYEEKYTGNGNIAEGYLPASVFTDLPIDEQYRKTKSFDLYTDNE